MAGVRRSLVFEVVRMALDAMRANKMRSFLTVLGVVIGVGTVIAMGALVQGLDRSMARQFRTFGSHVLWIRAFSQNGPHVGGLPDSLRLRHHFTDEDLDAVRDNCPAVRWLAPLSSTEDNPNLTYGHEKARGANVLGTTPEYLDISGLGVARGRAFTEAEVAHSAQVIMLGQDILETLFPNTSSVGKTVHMAGIPFVVVGEITRRGKQFGQSTDNLVILPYTTLNKYYADPTDPRSHEFDMKAKPVQDDLMQVAMDQITEVLRRQRHLKASQSDNFAIESDDAILTLYHQLTAAIYLVMMAISSIALMVGGIGVMNIMLVSVTERTYEIGIRKAIGARKADILIQFLIEAASLTGLGGICGIIFGWIISVIAGLIFKSLPTSVPAWAAMLGIVVSVGVGLFFGIWPANKAARLDPVEALRYE